MEAALKFILSAVWLGLIPYGLGLSLSAGMKSDTDSFWKNMMLGYVIMLALFELLCVPAIFLRLKFSLLCNVYGGLLLLLLLISLIRQRRRIYSSSIGHLKMIGKVPAIMWVAFILIAVQIIIYLVGMFSDADDALYVAEATTAMQTDGLYTHNVYTGFPSETLDMRYVLSPFPIFLGFVSRMSGLHPTIMAHTVMPVFFVMLAYGVYSLWVRKLFGEKWKSVGVFLCFVSLIHMFSNYSVYTQGTFMLVRIWQGKAFLAAVLLPALLYVGWLYFEEKTAGFAHWFSLFLFMTACAMVSSMGILLAPIMLGMTAIVAGIYHRRWKRIGLAAASCIPSVLLAVIYLIL